MQMIEHLIKHTFQHDHKIKKLTHPLKTTFGITEFWHYAIYPDGTFIYLANHPDISDYYWGSHLYKLCPFFRHPSRFRSHLLPSTLNDPNYQASQSKVKEKCQMQLPFNLIHKRGAICHGFGFSTRDLNFPLDSTCINHLSQLNQFCEFFLQEAAEIERGLFNEQFNIGELLGKLFHQPVSAFIDVPVDLKEFYARLKGQKEVKLSQREKECLAHFLRGSSCPEIAEELDLSPRTVESYFVSIKRKFNCDTKSELFKRAQELERFGLFEGFSF